MKTAMLTTIDNPFNPFTQFDEWLNYDTNKGYHTCAYLARITKSSPEISEEDEAIAIEAAIDEIVKENVLGIYRKIEMTLEKTDKDPFDSNKEEI